MVLMCVSPAVPFVSSSTAGLYEAIRAPEPVQLPEQPAISPQLRSLLAGLLDKDPSTRTKLHEVRAACGSSLAASWGDSCREPLASPCQQHLRLTCRCIALQQAEPSARFVRQPAQRNLER
jgi:hypothetical protein